MSRYCKGTCVSYTRMGITACEGCCGRLTTNQEGDNHGKQNSVQRNLPIHTNTQTTLSSLRSWQNTHS